MGFPIIAGDRVHFVGDSITNFGWFNPTGGFVDQVNATWASPAPTPIPASASGGHIVVTGGVAIAGNTQPTRRAITVTSSGVVGNKAADIAGDVASRIVAFNPTKVILEVVINDVIQGTAPTAFAASYDSIITQTLSSLPSVKFLCLSALCYGEQWQAGPAWGPNTGDSQIITLDNAIQTICTNRGMFYADTRAAQVIYESINNTPAPGAVDGFVTADAVHPINPSGQVLMGTWVFPAVTVTP